LVVGGELFDKIVQSKRFNEDTARNYFQQLVLGTYYCHAQGIAHRDLKPENLMLDENGTLKISDFGLSNMQKTSGSGRIGPAEQLHTMCGTPEYVAPEVLTGKGYSGFTADCWSCGVILYVMLAGSLPFRDTDSSNVFHKIKHGQYEMKPYFSEAAKDMLRHLLVVNPSERYTLDQVVQHEWFRVGFDYSKLDELRTLHPMEPTQDQLDQAITNVVDEDEENDVAPPPYLAEGSVELLQDVRANPAFQNPSFVDRHTKFGLNMPPDQVASSIMELLVSINAHPETKKDMPYEIKGSVDLPRHEILTYAVSIGRSRTTDVTVVEIRRGRGNTLDFHDFYRRVVDLLAQKSSVTGV